MIGVATMEDDSRKLCNDFHNTFRQSVTNIMESVGLNGGVGNGDKQDSCKSDVDLKTEKETSRTVSLRMYELGHLPKYNDKDTSQENACGTRGTKRSLADFFFTRVGFLPPIFIKDEDNELSLIHI